MYVDSLAKCKNIRRPKRVRDLAVIQLWWHKESNRKKRVTSKTIFGLSSGENIGQTRRSREDAALDGYLGRRISEMQRFCRSKICSAFGVEAILHSRALILQKTKQIEIQVRALCQESGKSFLAPKIAKEPSASGRRRIFEFPRRYWIFSHTWRR